MTLRILFSGRDGLWDAYKEVLPKTALASGLDIQISSDLAPKDVDYIVYAPNDALTDFKPFTRAKAVLSLWAGVETIVGNATLTQPLCRMVDDGLELGMTQWVSGHVLRHHLGMDRHILGLDGVWDQTTPPLARDRTVAILGIGTLGAAAAKALAALGFNVLGWSRRKKKIEAVTSFTGAEGLDTVLSRAEICVLMLPNTPQTQNILDANALKRLPKGAVILNPGRGALIDDAALLAALDDGHIAHATLDTFKVEPLPYEHPYWHHPNVTVTPHIAAETRPETASQVIVENIKRCEAGQPLLHLVDRSEGY